MINARGNSGRLSSPIDKALRVIESSETIAVARDRAHETIIILLLIMLVGIFL